MAVLSDQDRTDVSAEFQREISDVREAFGVLTKTDIRSAVNALDNFLDTNASAINTAIPQPARAQLTTSQKARLLKHVITKRYIKGS